MRIVLLHGLLTDLSPPGLARLVADPLEGDLLLVRRRDRAARRGVPPRADRRPGAHQLRRLRALLPAALPPAPVRRARPRRGGVDRRLAARAGAVPRLRAFEKPVTLAWAREDRLVFPPSIAERLAADFPRARIEWIDDSLTLVPEDRPDALAAILRAAAGVSSQ